MANRTDTVARQIHGTDPQLLIEKIIRNKVYDTQYWREECFGLNAATLVDKAVELRDVAGTLGSMRAPSKFICLLLKMLQIQPEPEIINEYITDPNFKYLRLLGAAYVRLTGQAKAIYTALEPLLEDSRKVVVTANDGRRTISHVDAIVDGLLRDGDFMEITLPRITRRAHLEEQGQLQPRTSTLGHTVALAADIAPETRALVADELAAAADSLTVKAVPADADYGRGSHHVRGSVWSRSDGRDYTRGHERHDDKRDGGGERDGRDYGRGYDSARSYDSGRERGHERERDRDRDRDRDRECGYDRERRRDDGERVRDHCSFEHGEPRSGGRDSDRYSRENERHSERHGDRSERDRSERDREYRDRSERSDRNRDRERSDRDSYRRRPEAAEEDYRGSAAEAGRGRGSTNGSVGSVGSSGSSSYSSGRERSERDRERDREREHGRDREHRSDRSDRERSDRERSDRERSDRERSDRDRSDRHRSDRDRGDRERSDRSDRDRDRDRDRKRGDREQSERSDHRDRDRSNPDRSDRDRSNRDRSDGDRTIDTDRTTNRDHHSDRDRERSDRERSDLGRAEGSERGPGEVAADDSRCAPADGTDYAPVSDAVAHGDSE